MANQEVHSQVRKDIFVKLKHLLTGAAKHLDPDQILQKDDTSCSLAEVGAGNMNYVMRLKYGEKSAIVKYAPPYIKLIGPEAPISPERGKKEFICMKRFEQICPGSVPKPLYFAEEEGLLLMDDLTHHEVLKFAMKDAKLDMKAVEKLAKDIAVIHRQTHVSNMNETDFTRMIEEHRNPEMAEGLTREYVFEKPFDPNDPTNHSEEEVNPIATRLRENPQILAARDVFKDLYLNKKECLLHGDLHNGSVMVHDGDAKIIDSEFCTVGPASWDVSYIIAHFIFSYLLHLSSEGEDGKLMTEKIAAACKATLDIYEENMRPSVSDLHKFYRDFYSELAGFIGIELIRRTMGVAHPEDIRGLGTVEKQAIEVGESLLLQYKVITDKTMLLKALYSSLV